MAKNWISINEKLPEDCQNVLVWGEGHLVVSAVFVTDPDKFYWDEPDGEEMEWVTHWIEYPDPPKKAEYGSQRV
jgi:hypothetical protein